MRSGDLTPYAEDRDGLGRPAGTESALRGPEPAVLVSALNHYLYCPRRCALIHVEGVFVENVYTLQGRYAHERSDKPSLRIYKLDAFDRDRIEHYGAKEPRDMEEPFVV